MSGSTTTHQAQVLMAAGLQPIDGSGHNPLLTVMAPQVGLPEAPLMYDATSGRLVLAAPCGCHIYVDLRTMVVSLSETKRKGHAGDVDGSHVH